MKDRSVVAILFAVILSGLATPRCLAQDLEIFERDDALYPDELVLSLHGEPARPRRFLALRLLTGFDAQYQFRNQFPGNDVYFLRTALTYYASRLQVSVKATGFRATRGLASPEVNVRSQIGYYTMGRTNRANRVQLTWDVRSSPGIGVTHDLTVDFDYSYRLAGREWIGGFAFAWAPTNGALYFGGSYRVQLVSLRGGSTLTFGYGVGTDQLQRFSMAGRESALDFAKGELAVEIPIHRLDGVIHIAYAPAYRFGRHRWNQELGAFLELPITARLF